MTTVSQRPCSVLVATVLVATVPGTLFLATSFLFSYCHVLITQRSTPVALTLSADKVMSAAIVSPHGLLRHRHARHSGETTSAGLVGWRLRQGPALKGTKDEGWDGCLRKGVP